MIFQPLLQKTMVIVAHPDDEAVGCGALMQRMREAVVVFATDGAPRDSYFWQAWGSREKYAALRRREAERAVGIIGGRSVFLRTAEGCIADQELYLHLPKAYVALASLAAQERPAVLLTLAYEGGHPDHDCCSILTSVLARELGLPAWEMPLYQRGRGELLRQQFLRKMGTEAMLELTPREWARKREMFAAYETQAHVMAEFAPDIESFRPMVTYDYSRPPHEGALNYEAWGWAVRGDDVCRQAAELMKSIQTRAVNAGDEL